VLAAGAAPDITVVVTHGVFAHHAEEVLVALPIARIVTTDSIPSRSGMRLPVRARRSTRRSAVDLRHDLDPVARGVRPCSACC
jgi:hypothetical protein